MKKIFALIIILFLIFSINILMPYSKTKTVLLAGDIVGFELENDEEDNNNANLVPTSAKKVATVTFIEKESCEFAAVGHPIITKSEKSNLTGPCYQVNLKGIGKSDKNLVGTINAVMDRNNKIGEVISNSQYGAFGVMDNINLEEYKEIETASRYEIQKGEADIYINLNGKGLESYKIEITGFNHFDINKNIKLKVIDEELIGKTGGIVQGMSGAPIVQNGKLIGAINYVNNRNPKNAYAIFIDKLI